MRRSYVLSILLLGCHGSGATLPWGPKLLSTPSATPNPTVRLPAPDPNARADVQALVAATNATIQLDDFKKEVANTTMAKGPLDASVTGTSFLTEYLAPTNPRSISVIGNSRRSVAYTDLENGVGTVFLRRIVLDRWNDAAIEQKACAINTLAHEWTHTFGTGNDYEYTDGGHYSASAPLVSYTVGAFAQCEYLKQHAATQVDVRACVQRVGTIGFNANTCRPGWATTLAPPDPAPAPAPDPKFWATVEGACSASEKDHDMDGILDDAETKKFRAYCDARGTRSIDRVPIGDDQLEMLDARGDKLESVSAPDAAAPVGVSLESSAIGALTAVITARAKVELEQYAISTLKRLICEGERTYWFSSTCAFLNADDGELPVTFGLGMRTAFVDDLTHLPARLAADIGKGTSAGLVVTLFASASQLLVQRADLSAIANEMHRLAQGGFVCTQEGTERVDCTKLLHAVGFAGDGLLALLEAKDGYTPGLLGELVTLATNAGFSADRIVPDEVRRLLTEIAAVRDSATKLAQSTTTDERIAIVRPFVQGAVTVVDHLLALAGANQRMPNGLPDLVDAIARGQLEAIATSALTTFAQLEGQTIHVFDHRVLRLISFAGEIAAAKDADQAKAAIEAVIAPVGSYRLKSAQPIVAIQAYVGAQLGKEHLSNTSLGDNSNTVFGPSGMVGIELSIPLCNRYIPSAALFGSVVDLGNLMSYRYASAVALNDGTDAKVSQSSNVGFAQVFSPGIFARVAIGDSPFVIGGGVSVAPDARSVTGVDGDVSAVRWSVFAGIDVTLLPFHL